MGLTTQSCWICPKDFHGRSRRALVKYTGSLLPLRICRVFKQWYKTYHRVHTIDFSQRVRVSFPAIFLFGRLHVHVTVEAYSGVLWILPQFSKNHRRQWEVLTIGQLCRNVKKKATKEKQTFGNSQMLLKNPGILSIENPSTYSIGSDLIRCTSLTLNPALTSPEKLRYFSPPV